MSETSDKSTTIPDMTAPKKRRRRNNVKKRSAAEPVSPRTKAYMEQLERRLSVVQALEELAPTERAEVFAVVGIKTAPG